MKKTIIIRTICAIALAATLTTGTIHAQTDGTTDTTACVENSGIYNAEEQAIVDSFPMNMYDDFRETGEDPIGKAFKVLAVILILAILIFIGVFSFSGKTRKYYVSADIKDDIIEDMDNRINKLEKDLRLLQKKFEELDITI